ncbi:MAG TPA: hypothetical protein VIF60_19900 [Burkholderiaceae bacterium]
MNAFFLAKAGLHVRLALLRFGWGNGIALVLLVCAGVTGLWLLPQLKSQRAAGQIALAKAQKAHDAAPLAALAPALPPTQQHLQDFYDVLGETRYAEQQVKTLFAIAAKNSLTLNQADYKFAFDKNGIFHTYVISLPVRGPYTAVRPFCEQVLLAIPFASLDQIDFKRDSVNNPNLEAKLRITLYLDKSGGTLGNAEAPTEKPAEHTGGADMKGGQS